MIKILCSLLLVQSADESYYQWLQSEDDMYPQNSPNVEYPLSITINELNGSQVTIDLQRENISLEELHSKVAGQLSRSPNGLILTFHDQILTDENLPEMLHQSEISLCVLFLNPFSELISRAYVDFLDVEGDEVPADDQGIQSLNWQEGTRFQNEEEDCITICFKLHPMQGKFIIGMSSNYDSIYVKLYSENRVEGIIELEQDQDIKIEVDATSGAVRVIGWGSMFEVVEREFFNLEYKNIVRMELHNADPHGRFNLIWNEMY